MNARRGIRSADQNLEEASERDGGGTHIPWDHEWKLLWTTAEATFTMRGIALSR